ncbi:GNAT family N-acetyltransferase [Nitratifractor sp.]
MTPIQALTPRQIEELHRLYRQQWWTRDRTLEETRSLVAHSDIVAGYADAAGHLAAFARVLSDFTIKALIFDLIVAEPYRNQGLGKALIQAILDHPALSRVRHFELYCLPEMAPYYETMGFEKQNDTLVLMRRNGSSSS